MIGVLLTWVNATKLEGLVYDRTGLQGTGELLVGVPEDSNTVRLLFPPLQNANVTEVPFDGAMARAIGGKMGIMRQRDYNGVKIIAAYRPVGFKGWGPYAVLSYFSFLIMLDSRTVLILTVEFGSGLLAKLEVLEAYAPVRNVRLVIIITIVVLVSLGVVASLGLAKVEDLTVLSCLLTE